MTRRTPPRHHAFTVKHSGIAHRILSPAWVMPAFDPDHPPSPLPPAKEVQALWDTGATASVLTATTATQLQLAPVGVVNVNHAGGTGISNTYLVNIMLPNNVGMKGILVSECPDVGGFDIIIGMDIITAGDFALTNLNGETVLSYCYPSRKVIDYVSDINKENFAGVGRNDPCPCGRNENGKPVKFKFCHGKP